MRRHFVPISTQTHAAPMASMIFGRVVEKKDAGRVVALLDQRQIARR